ncbi:MAG: hydroxymethylglutaryl-CoA synthase [Pseudomonadota bacterium]
MTKIGIDRLSFYAPQHYLDLATLAQQHGIDPEKFSRGIGQAKIAITTHDEDIVTLAAEAAKPIIEAVGTDGIDTLLFATESGIDQSKSAGIYVHRLLGLPAQCRNVELKQACYSATAGLQMACGYVARKPSRKVLVIASDVSRYDLDSPAEATQGSGAVAMLVSANPAILALDEAAGCHSEDIMDFWRPNYRKTPLVDGKYSTLKYMHFLAHAWADYQADGGRAFGDFVQFCYHLPFSRMAEKAHRHLSSVNKLKPDPSLIEPGMAYAREIGNCYSASLYLSLISMLETLDQDLTDKPVGLFSYGSGAVAEFFSGVVQDGYQEHLFTDHHRRLLAERTSLSYSDYLNLWNAPDPQDGSDHVIAPAARGQYRLARINEHKRLYDSADT